MTTNGYTSTLLPDIFGHQPGSRGGIVPKRTQLAAYTVPQRFIDAGGELDFSFVARGFYNASDVYRLGLPPQMVEEEMYGLTTSDGTIVLGSELAQRAGDIDGEDRRWMGHSNDSEVFEEPIACAFSPRFGLCLMSDIYGIMIPGQTIARFRGLILKDGTKNLRLLGRECSERGLGTSALVYWGDDAN